MQITPAWSVQPTLNSNSSLTGPESDDLRKAAEALEASFLTIMLGAAGVGETPDAFGGGVGEDQFSSFLREQYAQSMVDNGGIGLAEQIFENMKRSR